MPILRKKIRKDILEKPCRNCGHAINENAKQAISFYRGEFVMFHEKCFDEFMAKNVLGTGR